MKAFSNARPNAVIACLICALLYCALALGQQPAQPASAAGLPTLKGVYYRAGTGWANLPYTLLWPYNKSAWKWWLSVGGVDYFAELPGEHARVQMTDAQPVFYVRGLATQMGPRLIQFGAKDDFRRVKMLKTRNFEPRVPFAGNTMRNVEIAQVGPNVVSIRPAANLTPGEYAIVTPAGPDQQRLYLGFDFRVR